MIVAVVTALLCVLADRVTKAFAAGALASGKSVTVFEGVLNFTYVENRGMAFGLLAEHRYLFMALSVILLVAIALFLFWYRRQAGLWLKLSCGLILGGGIGNMIDRVSLGYVVDFIDVRLFSFWKWVFNAADMFVCIGVFMLAIYLILDSSRCSRQKKSAAVKITKSEETESEWDDA